MALKTSYMGAHLYQGEFLRITGNDALRFLQGMWTGDLKLAVKTLPSVLGAYLLDLKAKPVAPAQILCLSEKEYLLLLPRGRARAVYEALDRYLVADDVRMEFEESPYRVLEIFESPFSGDLHVDEFRVPPIVAADQSRVYRAQSLDGSFVMPLGELGSQHFQLWLSPDKALPQFRALSEEELTSLYVRAGRARWGVDLAEDSLILEFPFASNISFHKGCYIGQEVVARATYRGQVAKAFARFHCAGPAQIGFVFRRDSREKPVGKITSASGSMATGLLRLREYEQHSHVIVADGSLHETTVTSIECLHSRIVES